MNIVPTNFTVNDFCDDLQTKKLIVNHKYQRSDKVWPPVARSFFIETILLSFPVPKLSLYQVTDLKSRKTHKEIVDGQQRSLALLDFYQDDLRLSPTLETKIVAGKKYSQLSDEDKTKFLTYSLSCDLFVGATEADIREVFRRINAYTVPLNPEEQRHAIYQGEMKWFIHHLSRELEATFLELGVFGDKQLVRMADAKLLADLCYAFLHGIKTTKRVALDNLYKENDGVFVQAKLIRGRIRTVFKRLYAWTGIHGTSLMKPHIVYSLALAVSHVLNPASVFQPHHKLSGPKVIADDKALPNLTVLSDVLAMDEDNVPEKFREFHTACSQKTNVDSQRIKRFQWLCRALTTNLG